MSFTDSDSPDQTVWISGKQGLIDLSADSVDLMTDCADMNADLALNCPHVTCDIES